MRTGTCPRASPGARHTHAGLFTLPSPHPRPATADRLFRDLFCLSSRILPGQVPNLPVHSQSVLSAPMLKYFKSHHNKIHSAQSLSCAKLLSLGFFLGGSMSCLGEEIGKEWS